VPSCRNKVPSFRSNVNFSFCFLKKFWFFSRLLKTRKNKEEKGRKKKILPSSLFFYFLFSFSFLFFL